MSNDRPARLPPRARARSSTARAAESVTTALTGARARASPLLAKLSPSGECTHPDVLRRGAERQVVQRLELRLGHVLRGLARQALSRLACRVERAAPAGRPVGPGRHSRCRPGLLHLPQRTAPWSLPRALLTPRVNPGSYYRCAKST